MMLRVGGRSLVIALSANDRQHVHADIKTPKATVSVDVHANVALDQTGDPWIPAVTPAAMKLGCDVSTGSPVDDTLLSNVTEAQSVLHSWYRDLQPISIDAPPGSSAPERGRAAGCFFSGGVDSFYSATQLGDEISHLIFVHGFDVDIQDGDLAAKALAGARAAAQALGKVLIEVRTNLRHFTDRSRCQWGAVYHGAALTHVGLLLSDHLDHIYIPSTYNSSELVPWGSHPDLDPLWSSSRVEFIHHGVGSTRPQKVRALVDNDAAMENLRVCWQNPGGEYNCGRCEKCVRTILNIQAAGGAGRCRTLPSSVSPKALRTLRVKHGGQVWARENLAAMRASGVTDPALEKSMTRMIRRGYLHNWIHRAKSRAYKMSPSEI